MRKDCFRWLKRAPKIVVTDPRIRQLYHQRDVIDFVSTVLRSKEPDDLLPIKALRIADDNITLVSNAELPTSGIPAVLHPNEAVIPLSRGRKIPVEKGDSAGGRTIIHAPQTINIQTPDADSFRRSQKQIAADMARAGQRAVSQNG